jgi:hypothetical protein
MTRERKETRRTWQSTLDDPLTGVDGTLGVTIRDGDRLLWSGGHYTPEQLERALRWFTVQHLGGSHDEDVMRLRRGIRNALRDLDVGDHIRVTNAKATLRAVLDGTAKSDA